MNVCAECCACALRVEHALNCIVKPAQLSQVANSREMEDAMRKVKEAQSLISAAVEPGESPVLLHTQALALVLYKHMLRLYEFWLRE